MDGGTISVDSIVTLKYYEIAPWILISNLYSGSFLIVMNLDFYNSLCPDVRKMLDDTVLAAEKDYYEAIGKQYDQQGSFP